MQKAIRTSILTGATSELPGQRCAVFHPALRWAQTSTAIDSATAPG